VPTYTRETHTFQSPKSARLRHEDRRATVTDGASLRSRLYSSRLLCGRRAALGPHWAETPAASVPRHNRVQKVCVCVCLLLQDLVQRCTRGQSLVGLFAIRHTGCKRCTRGQSGSSFLESPKKKVRRQILWGLSQYRDSQHKSLYPKFRTFPSKLYGHSGIAPDPSFQPRGWNIGLTKSDHVPRETRGHPTARRARCPSGSVCSKSVEHL
jgi:hypothetical protein